MKNIALLLFCCFLGLNLYGQEYTITHLSVEDGLPSNRVYHVFKDSKGYMWFCTDLGVSRYNGTEIETFTTDDGLTDNDVFSCFEDKWGRIWFATYSGSHCFFQHGKIFNPENHNLLNRLKPISFMGYYFQNPKDSSFKIIYGGFTPIVTTVFKNTFRKDTFYSDPVKKESSFYDPDFLHENSNKTIFIRHPTKGLPLNKNMNVSIIKSGNIIKLAEGFNQIDFRIILSKNCSKPMFCFKNRLYDPAEEKYIPITASKNDELYSYLKDNSTTYVGFKNGLQIIKNGIITKHLPNKLITSIQKGTYNDLFCSTYKHGVYILTKKLSSKLIPVKVNAALRENQFKLLADQNSIFLYSYHLNKLIRQKTQPAFQFKPSKDKIVYLVKLDGFIYTISKYGLVDKMSHSTSYDQNFLKKEKTITHTVIGNQTDYLKFNTHSILERTSAGLSLLKPGKKNPIVYLSEVESRWFSIDRGPQNTFWASSRDGIFQVSENHAPKELKHLHYLELRKICILGQSLIGISVKGKLFIIDHFQDEEKYTIKEVNTRIKGKSLKKINRHTALIEITGGLKICMQKQGQQPISIAPTDILLSDYTLSDIISDDSLLYLKNNETTSVVPIEEIVRPNWQPVLNIRNLFLDGKPVQLKETVSTSYQERDNILIRYQVMTKPMEPKLTYAYAILSNRTEDTIWNQTNSLEVQMNNSSWGAYTILFRAQNYYGTYSNTAALKLIINRPMYLTWWFIITALISVMFIIYIITNKIQQAKHKKELEKKITETKILKSEFKSLNALMNPHFIFNSLNNIQGIINNNDNEGANKYLEIFSQLVRQNMKNIQFAEISLEQELTLVENYLKLEKLRFREKLNYKLEVSNATNPEEIKIPPLSIQPIVENAIKHGIFPKEEQGGFIDISVTTNEQKTTIQILDNGIGYSNSIKGKGNSLALNNIKHRFDQLAKIHSQKIEFSVGDYIVGETIMGTIATIEFYWNA